MCSTRSCRLFVPVPPIAEVQVALQQAVVNVTGLQGQDVKTRMRTGTVATTDNRNWELRYDELFARLNQSRAIAVDMESATIAANGFRFRVPYGTLLCVSDKPLHGELKLRGMANTFYRERIDQHLQIGLEADAHPARAGRRPAALAQAAQLRRAGVPLAAPVEPGPRGMAAGRLSTAESSRPASSTSTRSAKRLTAAASWLISSMLRPVSSRSTASSVRIRVPGSGVEGCRRLVENQQAWPGRRAPAPVPRVASGRRTACRAGPWPGLRSRLTCSSSALAVRSAARRLDARP